MKSLATKGVLEVRRGSGTYVVSRNTIGDDPLGLARFTDKYKLALELFEVRLMLEPEIAALACDYITPEEKEELERLCGETEELYPDGGGDFCQPDPRKAEGGDHTDAPGYHRGHYKGRPGGGQVRDDYAFDLQPPDAAAAYGIAAGAGDGR